MNRIKRTEEMINTIIDMYNDGDKITTIAKAVGISPATYDVIIRKLKSEGKVIPRRKTRKKSIPSTKKQKNIINHDVNDGDIVYCDRRNSRQCIYGNTSNADYLCNYFFVENKLRGCSFKECDKFQKITKTNPRRAAR